MTSLANRLRSAFDPANAAEEIVYADDLPGLTKADNLQAAAVLVPVVDAPEPRLLLTVRHAGLRKHAGQIAFPGGRRDPEDRDIIATALREAQEEVGLAPERVDVVGIGPDYRTGTGYNITPVIAVIPDGVRFSPQEAEVSGIFEPPLAFLLDPANQQRKAAFFQGAQRHFYEIMWQDYRIWGATAGLIVNLSARLRAFA
jgi:8-oxo-dGTP pyrophosphatase MutT (NUDIX family)